MKLTKYQRATAESKMNFVYWFISNKKQPKGMTWDELASEYSEALCLAVYHYKPNAGKRTLEAYIFRAMLFRRADLFRFASSIKRGSRSVIHSIDQIKDEVGSYPEELSFTENEFWTNEEMSMVLEAMEKLNSREKSIVKSRLKGKSFEVISRKFIAKKETIRKIYNRAEDKLRRIVLKSCA